MLRKKTTPLQRFLELQKPTYQGTQLAHGPTQAHYRYNISQDNVNEIYWSFSRWPRVERSLLWLAHKWRSSGRLANHGSRRLPYEALVPAKASNVTDITGVTFYDRQRRLMEPIHMHGKKGYGGSMKGFLTIPQSWRLKKNRLRLFSPWACIFNPSYF